MRALTIAAFFACVYGATTVAASTAGSGAQLRALLDDQRKQPSTATQEKKVSDYDAAVGVLKKALAADPTFVKRLMAEKKRQQEEAKAEDGGAARVPPQRMAEVGGSGSEAKVSSQDFWDICDQVNTLGFTCEHHTSVTEDGFELDIVRIPPQPKTLQPGEELSDAKGYPVILQHGLIDTASAWVANYFPYQNLGTILAARGYDVFMPNARGNHYSEKNNMYPNTLNEYWQRIDMDFMAKYDMPANIEYVLNFTNRTTLSYAGHSQGGMMGFGAFSTWRPDLAPKVDYFFALAPACWVHHTTAVVIQILAGLDVAQWLSFYGVKSFLDNSVMEWVMSQICPLVGFACAMLLDVLCGISQQTNTSQMATITRYTPGGTSVNNMIHWAQEVSTESWSTHDYGSEDNLKYWGTATNPPYTPNAMNGPKTVVFYGSDDALADPTDVKFLLEQVPARTVVESRLLYGYAHLDFTWGVNAHIDIYPTIVSYLGNLTKK